MIRFLYADDLARHPRLARSMFRDRALQFSRRLGWDVQVDETGEERDAYDALNPLYVIWENAAGLHGGSMRFLPTTGQTMVNDHFLHLTGRVRISSALIWECTRFCIAPSGPDRAHQVAGALMLAACAMGIRFGLQHAVGVFDARMVRIYRRLGWQPDVLGTSGNGEGGISVGLWEFSAQALAAVADRSSFPGEVAFAWLDASLSAPLPASAAA